MNGKRILVVEDDAAIRRGLVDALSFAGYATLEASEGAAALASALESDCDLLLLDLVLPGCDGLTVLRELRGARSPLPVIVLTARGAEDDRVRGLGLGADDYVVKPFSIKELLARIEAVLRRCAGAASGRPATGFRGRPGRPGRTRGPFRRRRALRAFGARATVTPLPRLSRRADRLSRRVAGARLGPEPVGDHHEDDRHAHRPASREAPRRSGEPPNRADGPRPGVHDRRQRIVMT